jgi:hypothetical protein
MDREDRKERQMSNYFEELNKVNVNDKTEDKGKLTYLSWAWAWSELKKRHPDANYTIYENEHGWNYHTDGRYAWVKTGVTVEGIEHIEYLPIMDYKNNSITADRITSFDVNKTIQRSLTKAIARHGLGLYIYAGEDLPDEADGLASDRQSVLANETQEKIEEEAEAKKTMQKKITKRELADLMGMMEQKGVPDWEIAQAYKVEKLQDLTKAQQGNAMASLMAMPNKEA